MFKLPKAVQLYKFIRVLQSIEIIEKLFDTGKKKYARAQQIFSITRKQQLSLIYIGTELILFGRSFSWWNNRFGVILFVLVSYIILSEKKTQMVLDVIGILSYCFSQCKVFKWRITKKPQKSLYVCLNFKF